MAALVAFVTAPGGRAALVGDAPDARPEGGALGTSGPEAVGPVAELARRAAELEAAGDVRWVWWSAGADAAALAGAAVPVARCWDVAEAHRLLAGGWEATPQVAWATARGLDRAGLPEATRGDLFDFDAAAPMPELSDVGLGRVVRPDGYLDPDAGTDGWHPDDDTLLAWARTALECARAQQSALAEVGPRAVAAARSESAAAFLCLELARDGLPVDRATAEQMIAEAAGARPTDEAHARRIRAERDTTVLRHTPGRETTDLRNPVQVKELLASVGVVVPNTRKWVLEPFRDTHPVVDALLEWRKAERIATTYGYPWLDAHVGPDDRLRGGWTACDGAAGRMTAQNGLHNLPTALRPAVAAHPGHLFVRADLGQIEPRVLAAVSGDEAFAAATRADDLYAPVAAALGVDRPVAKIAVLAAMYGQRSGAAGEALKDLERTYPVAMGYLDAAYAAGLRREPLRTFGGRLIRLDAVLADVPAESAAAYDAARGRFARNAVIQGSAAELFKAWAATVRATTRDLGAQIVLCLHDELLVHVPAQHAEEARARLEQALTDSARRWTGSSRVRFVADASIIHRWSEAKD
ncbi:DNA polymerase-1 [Pedococcus dokdonensis]|uniref:DNA-directed DNA polymerase n=1 Tax=Pedococcus dokdonensis TaxID=443156 RepID=A0A1H0MI25_9MICO|nr:DNA polymerase [Pedococcus dokdonensis]SDO80014.1 DNA polymerase-1 [Pedococcus dokdonensis]